MVTFIRAIAYFGDLISTALFARAILSWLVRGTRSRILGNIYRVLHFITEPIVSPCRRLMNRFFNTGMFDFSIFIAMIMVELVTRVIVRFLLILV